MRGNASEESCARAQGHPARTRQKERSGRSAVPGAPRA